MQTGLSFEQAPPISVPYRFFLTAPLFGIAAGLLILLQGGDVLASRWTPASLALTHLLAVGFMLQVMCGAMLQVLPVAAGANVWRPRLMANLTYPGLTLGGILLVSGFLTEQALLFQLAVILLSLTLGFYAVVVLGAVIFTPAKGPTILTLRVALPALIVTVTLGATLGSAFGWHLGLPVIDITHIHASWGLGGWGLLLVGGVGYLVVPMFQLTPTYPAWFSRSYALALFGLLTLWSLAWLLADRPLLVQEILATAAAVLVGLYAVLTLNLQRQRRRKIIEPTLLFWRMAMVCLILAALGVIVLQVHPASANYEHGPYLMGVLLLVGVFVSVISGMLYKITPFLNWLHLQTIGRPGLVVPNIRQMVPEARMFMQFRFHVAAVVLLLGAVWLPPLIYAGGLALLASCAWLEWNLVTATRNYLRFRQELQQMQPAKPAA